MGIFIKVDVDRGRCSERDLARLAEVCPVNVFSLADGRPVTDPDNEDECTLCGLCVRACPEGAVIIRRLYLGATDS